jgi:hypothetical protein
MEQFGGGRDLGYSHMFLTLCINVTNIPHQYGCFKEDILKSIGVMIRKRMVD